MRIRTAIALILYNQGYSLMFRIGVVFCLTIGFHIHVVLLCYMLDLQNSVTTLTLLILPRFQLDQHILNLALSCAEVVHSMELLHLKLCIRYQHILNFALSRAEVVRSMELHLKLCIRYRGSRVCTGGCLT